MQCLNPVRITKNLDPKEYPDGLSVPCGQCRACRISKRREWSMRMLHESSCHDDAIFVTLTYDDNHLPPYASLQKRELQKFFKRLRRDLPDHRKIKYFACGEYGPQTERPHYHMIIFGLSLKTEDKVLVMDNWPFCDWNNPYIVKKSFGLAEPKSIQYVAQYIDDKLNGDLGKEFYENKGREPVFKVMSLGIGKQFALKNADQIREQKHLTVNGIPMSIPRYYVDLLDISRDELQEFAKENSIKKMYDLTGMELTPDDAFKKFTAGEWYEVNKTLADKSIQMDKNLNAKSNLHKKVKI